MIVTINTDAAWHSDTKIGGYAFWITCDEGRMMQSGVLKRRAGRPEIAEFKCILNALWVVGVKKLKNVSKIIVNTDCLNVIHLVTGDKKAIKLYKLYWGKYLVKEYTLLLTKFKIKKSIVKFRHVKSHNGTETKREYVNDWCDRSAKEEMWKAVNRKLVVNYMNT